jgi:hypothetical protein
MGSESTRRDFLKQVTAAAAVATAAQVLPHPAAAQPAPSTAPAGAVPWYGRTYRWSQTNITEIDPTRYDIGWWRQHWKRTEVQGVIVNAGGIVAYYPTKFELQYRPAQLGNRDLYGEVTKAAHDDGLVVLARMDSNRAHENLFRAHPDWFAMDSNNQVIRAADLYVTCINSPYYNEYLPDVMREIIQRSRPEGFTDNSWAGLERNQICYCENCKKKFRDAKGKDLPAQRDWDNAAYRDWIEWSYARRLELWDFNNKVTRDAGGAECLWLGMNSAEVSVEARSFRDLKAVCERSEILMIDHQSRPEADGLQDNAVAGKMLHGILGPDKLIPESMPMYQNGRPATFRLSTKPPAEATMWMLSGFAGGIQPWYHHVAAYHEDRRAYKTAEPVMKWHKANEQYLVNRKAVASVGLIWSQRNTDFYGRDNTEELVEQPARGFTQALIRARIPFVPLHIDHIERESGNIRVLILPNLGAMSDAQVASIRKFVESGGALVASGETSLYTQYGDPRNDLALADLFGISGAKPRRRLGGGGGGAARASTQHTYLRLTPELRAQVYGPKSGDEPPITGAKRHLILKGFDETDILEFGGTLQPLTVAPGATVLATFIPSFPTYPPETAWMRTPKTDIPGIVVNEANGRRCVYFAADIDKQFANTYFPDHGDVLANAVRWAAGDSIPLEVTGPGLIDCELYQQPGRLILHLVNVTSEGTWRAPVHELIRVGPLNIRIKPPAGMQIRSVKPLVSQSNPTLATRDGWTTLELAGVLDHEVLVLEG